MRLLPGWLEFTLFGFTFSMNIFLGSLLLLPLVWVILSLYPFVEAWITGDKREHHILDRPRNNPVRTAVGAAAISMYLVLALATVNDIMAIKLGLSINDITVTLRALFFIAPVLVFFVVKRLCISLQRADRDLVLHGTETGRIVRTPEGEFYEVHEPLDAYTRWPLVQHDPMVPLSQLEGPPVDQHGVRRPRRVTHGARRALSDFYFRDMVQPVTPAELAAAHSHGEHDAIEAPTPQLGEPVSAVPGERAALRDRQD